MYIPIYLEIDDNKNPVYKEEFKNDISKLSEKEIIIATSEYTDIVETASNVRIIPEEIINKVDSLNVKNSNRGISIELQKNSELCEWLKNLIQEENESIEGFVVNGMYSFVYDATQAYDKKVVFSMGKLIPEKERLEEYAAELEKQNSKVSELEDKISEMQRQIDEKNDNLQRLQQKITDLSTELFKNNAERQYIDEQMELNEQRMDKSEKQKVLLSDLYASVLKELNETKTELLNLKNRGA